MDYELINGITLSDYQRLRRDSGWVELPKEQAESGLEHTFCAVSAVSEGNVIGMARIVWDRGYCAYLTDVIVDQRYRGQGVGSTLVKAAIDSLRSEVKEGWKVKLLLLSAKGKESFYEQFGFSKRPSDNYGCGMDMWL